MDEREVRQRLLERLRDLNRREQSTGQITGLDVDATATDLGVEPSDVSNILADFLTEGLVEGYAESMGHTATDGACRITSAGLAAWRASQD